MASANHAIAWEALDKAINRQRSNFIEPGSLVMKKTKEFQQISKRFRGFYPVVIDIETAGFDTKCNPLLEIAAVTLKMDEQGFLGPQETFHYHIIPFVGSILEAAALEFTGIKPDNPFRFAITEHQALAQLFEKIQQQVKQHNCQRAVMVAHNATFDQSFMQAATRRCKLQTNPFHHFTTFDTATLSGFVFGQTILARAVKMAGIHYEQERAHSAKYDAEITAQLFCHMVNKWTALGGWPLSANIESNAN